MSITNATRLSDFAAGIGTEGAILQIDNANQRIGIGTQLPSQMLEVAGIITAQGYRGDGSLLEGITSAGLGTAIGDTNSIEEVIYYTDDLLSVSETTTVNPPASASAAYTQYRDVKLETNVDLIIETGDDFIPDVLSLGEGSSHPNASGNGVFDEIYSDIIKNKNGLGAPAFANGLTSVGVATFSSDVSIGGTLSVTGNVSVGGTLTYEDVKNVDSVGLITARTGIKVTAGGIDVTAGGINVTGDSTFAGAINANGVLSIAGGADGTLQELRLAQGNASQKLATIKGHSANTNEKGMQFNTFHYTAKIPIKLASTGAIGLGGDNYGSSGQVLTSQGSGAVAQWATPAGGGWVPLDSTTATSGTYAYESTNIFSNNTTYQQFKIEFYVRMTGLGKVHLYQYDSGAWQGDGSEYRWENRVANGNSNAWTQTTSGGAAGEIPICNVNMYAFQGSLTIWNPHLTDVQATWVAETKGWYGFQNWSPSYDITNQQMDYCTTLAEREIGSGTPIAVGGFRIKPSATISKCYTTVYGLKTA